MLIAIAPPASALYGSARGLMVCRAMLELMLNLSPSTINNLVLEKMQFLQLALKNPRWPKNQNGNLNLKHA